MGRVELPDTVLMYRRNPLLMHPWLMTGCPMLFSCTLLLASKRLQDAGRKH